MRCWTMRMSGACFSEDDIPLRAASCIKRSIPGNSPVKAMPSREAKFVLSIESGDRNTVVAAIQSGNLPGLGKENTNCSMGTEIGHDPIAGAGFHRSYEGAGQNHFAG